MKTMHSSVFQEEQRAKVGDDEFLMEPGCELWMPKNTVHNFKDLDGETFRIAVVFAPPRKL